MQRRWGRGKLTKIKQEGSFGLNLRSEDMRKLKHPGTVMGLFALGLEVVGVASGAYVYASFPIRILGVPLFVPTMWVILSYLAYLLYNRYGIFGILSVWLIDLLCLEPIAYTFNLWRWTQPYTVLTVPFGTVANAGVWIFMMALGTKLWGMMKS